MTTLESQRENAQQIRLALLSAMQDIGSPKDIIECDYLSAGDSVPATEVKLGDVCGGQKRTVKQEVDPYLKIRMAAEEFFKRHFFSPLHLDSFNVNITVNNFGFFNTGFFNRLHNQV